MPFSNSCAFACTPFSTSATSAFRDKLQWSELRSSLIAFVTAMVLIQFGLKQESPKAAAASLIIAVAFLLSEVLFGYYRGRGKITWKLKEV